MRLIIHTQYYSPEMGAPQARLSDLARRLKHLGHEVEVLTALPNYPIGRVFDGYRRYYMREEIDNICIYRAWILPSNKHSLIHRLISYLSFCISSLLVGLVCAGQADIIFTESPPLFLGVTGWLLARMKGARWILNISDLWPDSAKHVGMLPEKSFSYQMLQVLAYFLYQRAWLVTGQSREISAEIHRQVQSVQVYHLSNGADIECFHPRQRKEKIRQQYLRGGKVGLVYAGLHGLFQGLDQIIIAAERLKEEPVRFIFFGDGPEKGALVKMAGKLGLNNIDFYSPIAHESVPSILASMDIAIITLKSPIHGAVPSKIYEAMASGTTILLVADGEARDIVQQAQAGVIVSPGDIEGLIKAMRELSFQPELCKQMGQNGRFALTKLYDRQKIVNKFEKMLMGKKALRIKN